MTALALLDRSSLPFDQNHSHEMACGMQKTRRGSGINYCESMLSYVSNPSLKTRLLVLEFPNLTNFSHFKEKRIRSIFNMDRYAICNSALLQQSIYLRERTSAGVPYIAQSPSDENAVIELEFNPTTVNVIREEV